MRPACIALVLFATGQDADRTRFDALLKQLEDDSIDVREAAAKALAEFPAAADAWLKETGDKADGERKIRVIAVQTERAVRVETTRLAKAGVSEELMRALRMFARRLTSDDPEERLSLLQEASGVTLDPRDDDPTLADASRTWPATPHELTVMIETALSKPTSPRLKRQVLAILKQHGHPVLMRAARSLLADQDQKVRDWALECLGDSDADLTLAAPIILRLLKDGVEGASDLIDRVNWTASLPDAIAALRVLTHGYDLLAYEILNQAGDRDEPTFRALLHDKELKLRKLAIDYYRCRRAPLPVGDLVKILDEPNEALRLSAFQLVSWSLSKERLVKEASSSNAEVRSVAIRALAESGAPEAVDLVRRELKAGRGVWAAAAIADPSMREAVEACAKLDDWGLARYLEAIGDEAAAAAVFLRIAKQGHARAFLSDYVRVAGDEAVDVLIGLAGSPDEALRAAAAEELLNFPIAKAQEALTVLLKDPSTSVRSTAARSFRGWSGPKNWEFAKDRLHAQAFAHCFDGRVCIPDDANVREALAGTALIPLAIRALLETESADARRAVETRIESMTDLELRRVDHSLFGVKPPALLRDRLLKLTTVAAYNGAVDYPLTLLGDVEAARCILSSALMTNDFRHAERAHLLPQAERERFFAAGIEAAICAEARRRSRSLSILANAGSDEALDALVDHERLSADPHPSRELERLEPGRVLPRVRRLAESKVASERRMAARLMGLMGDPADRPRLVALLKDPSPLARAQAAEGLGGMGSVTSADAIAALLKDADDDVREDACRALAALAAGPLDALTAACGDPVNRIRREALLARLAQGDPSCADAVADLLKRELMRFPVDRLEPLAGSPRIAELLRERLKRRFDPFILKLLARAGDKDAIARLKKEGTAPCQGVLIELGLHEHPAEALSLLPWALESDAEALLVPMNRAVDATRYDGMMKRRTERRWLGPKASDLAAVLSELWGVQVKVDGSVRDRDRGSILAASRGLRVVLGAVPVFEGDGITLYSYATAKGAWEKRFRK